MRRTACLLLFLALAVSSAWAAGWTKYVAPDKSFSFHYPEGFTSQATGSLIELTNPAEEQLLLIALPFIPIDTAHQHAEKMLALLQQKLPDLQATNWAAGNAEATVTCEVTYTAAGNAFRGEVLVIRSDNNAAWFSYSAPSPGYSRVRAAGLLAGLVQSISAGEASEAPAFAPSSPLAGKAQAFLFVMEFSLGFPLTAQQERLVRDELLRGWSTASAADLAKYEAYPDYVKAIMKLEPKQLAAMQEQLAHTTREWLKTSPQTDPVVAMVKQQLAEKGKTLVAGTPPLTVMSARAYSELVAYAELLQCEPGATPDQIDSGIVATIQGQLTRQWPTLSKTQREQVRGTPALWAVLRGAMEQGGSTDRQQARAMLAKLARAAVAPAVTDPGGAASTQKPLGMTTHWALMQMQKQTFNTWQWSRGYKSTMFGF